MGEGLSIVDRDGTVEGENDEEPEDEGPEGEVAKDEGPIDEGPGAEVSENKGPKDEDEAD